MHPLEWFLHASYIVLPAFLFPMHLGLYMFVVACTFIAGFWDHAGIRFPFDLPLHGSNRFHDDHHKYFHVNFGFTCSIFDRIHDTVRREGHHYNEETFAGGKGRVLDPVLREKGAIGKWVDYSPAATDAILANRVANVKNKQAKEKAKAAKLAKVA
jgi:lathosterol oxidase